MKYTVVWNPDAERELTEIWLASSEKAIINRAAESLDHELAVDPLRIGESRSLSQRIAYSLPLGVRFQVNDRDRLVKVIAIWLCKRKSGF